MNIYYCLMIKNKKWPPKFVSITFVFKYFFSKLIKFKSKKKFKSIKFQSQIAASHEEENEESGRITKIENNNIEKRVFLFRNLYYFVGIIFAFNQKVEF